MAPASRRLAAIMFTDMVGYTALAQRDERLSLSLLETQRKLIRPLLKRHNGREVKTLGDAFLVEFASSLEAVQCAYDIQRAVREFNFSSPEDRPLQLRIGIHLGDVVHKRGDVLGDAVNIASRIEPLASPGGVCVTEHVYEHVKNKLDFPLASLGRRGLKNVDGEIGIYRVVFPWDGLDDEAGQPALDKLRLAVLPLANISSDPKDEYFADGMTEELISTISRIREFRVIARTSAMQYKGQPKRISEIGRELKAGTLIEGSVRRSADQVRISVQLVDASTEEHLWADDYERKLENVFQIQRDIATKVAHELKVKLLPEEKRSIDKKETGNPEAFTLYLKGRYYWNERSADGLKKAEKYFQKAIDADPAYARAYSGLADTYSLMTFYGILPYESGISKAGALAREALKIDDFLAEAHTSLAFIGDDDYDWEAAERGFRRALELNPSYATAHFWYSIQLTWRGRDEEALQHARQAEELDPLSPAISVAVGQALAYARRYDDAIRHMEERVKTDQDLSGLYFMLGLAYIFKGMPEKGAELERKCLALEKRVQHRPLAALGAAEAKMGKVREARETLARLERLGASLSLQAMVLVQLGDKEEAVTRLERAHKEGEAGLAWVSVIPEFDPVADDPRFLRVLRRMNLRPHRH